MWLQSAHAVGNFAQNWTGKHYFRTEKLNQERVWLLKSRAGRVSESDNQTTFGLQRMNAILVFIFTFLVMLLLRPSWSRKIKGSYKQNIHLSVPKLSTRVCFVKLKHCHLNFHFKRVFPPQKPEMIFVQIHSTLSVLWAIFMLNVVLRAPSCLNIAIIFDDKKHIYTYIYIKSKSDEWANCWKIFSRTVGELFVNPKNWKKTCM